MCVRVPFWGQGPFLRPGSLTKGGLPWGQVWEGRLRECEAVINPQSSVPNLKLKTLQFRCKNDILFRFAVFLRQMLQKYKHSHFEDEMLDKVLVVLAIPDARLSEGVCVGWF